MRENVFEFEIDDFDLKTGTQSLYARRTYCAGQPCVTKKFQSEVTIWIQAYNNFDKTKRCVESVLQYTKDVDFDLILVDNNAGDETYEYFKALDYPKKTVIHFNQNTGSAYPFTVVPIDVISPYFVLLNNDLIVTKNWLTNLLKIMKSDSAIGVVNPCSNNVSNLQGIEFPYKDYEDMQTRVETFNVSDNNKWEERLRVVTIGTLVRKECLYAMGWPFFDVGFSHNFMDDDMSFRVRRAGYKLIVTKDTWICHDHELDREYSQEELQTYDRDVLKFQRKYFGVHPWDDTVNHLVLIPELLEQVVRTEKDSVNILGVDTRCGTPILDVKNLFPYDKKVTMSAYCQDAKYYVDLCSICNKNVACDREENLKNYFEEEEFDYIVIGEPVNMYSNPFRIVKEAYELLASGGQLIFSFKNTDNVITILKAFGYGISINEGIYQNVKLDDFDVALRNAGIEISGIAFQYYDNMAPQISELMLEMLKQYGNKEADMDEISTRALTDKYWMVVRKE